MIMEEKEHVEIGERYIDVGKILAAKRVKAPKAVVKLLERVLCVPQLNAAIYGDREYFGLDFVDKFLCGHDPQDLGITIRVVGEENIPKDGSPLIVGNHPLGGPDGLALMQAVGRVRRDIKFPVNDFLCYLPGLKDLFVPIDKVDEGAGGSGGCFCGGGFAAVFPCGDVFADAEGGDQRPGVEGDFHQEGAEVPPRRGAGVH